MLRKNIIAFAVIYGLICAAPSQAASVPVYYANFDSPDVFRPGVIGGTSGYVSIVSSEGYAGKGTGSNLVAGNILYNDTGDNYTNTPSQATYFTLYNLPAHTSVDINFLLAIVDTWDGAGDFFNVTVDGTQIFNEWFLDRGDQVSRSFVPAAGEFVSSGYFGFEGYSDSLYNMQFDSRLHDIAHTSSTLTIGLLGGGSDWNRPANEAWGVDNIQIVLNGVVVPETSTFVTTGLLSGLMVCSLLIQSAKTRRRLISHA